MGMMYDSGWSIDTTEEISGSILFGVSSGKIYMSNASEGDSMVVSYRCVSVGAGKGPPVGAAWSKKTDPSGGFDNVGVLPGQLFDCMSFPCSGYMFGVGASAGEIGSILGMDVTGGGVSIALFGMWPVFAGVKLWGLGNGVLPGAGVTGGLAHFWIE
ncbi:hypothetical protein [Dyella silvatica]|uniref:hypothetical protein n=1 Tax=Dyella silvatica TaxID=2992128 RepID=UPI002256EB63|nr:hypothetical protein [Dyella silvatica]